MWDRPQFLDLPSRTAKPRDRGLTHVLDKGTPLPAVEGLLAVAAEYVDVVKIGWGISYLDATLKDRVSLYQSAGITVCLGGTLLEIAASQDRVAELREWVSDAGVDAIEIADGLCRLGRARKSELIAEFARDFVVLAEAGAKDAGVPVSADDWLEEMQADLEAGARWAIAEGRESGTVGLYEPDGIVRELLVEELAAALPPERVIFEAPRKSQQVWFVHRFGSDVNLGNIAFDEVLALETVRVGLRADTAGLVLPR